ncbi:hypothetical protein CJF32_00005852 [Rutstroemia sp. NJR-2017a WRK4]|nr:hypothetical protein CJF32_00005852 [Rutstroemia sp. NJR-2017a WRK4]
MASTNGVLSPPPQPDLNNTSINLSAKRKRDDSIDQPDLTNSLTNESKVATASPPTPTIDTQALVKDLIDVLKSHDPSPSILTRPLPERAPSAEPQTKRPKPDDAIDSPSIASKSAANKYAVVDEVLKDIDAAASDIIERLQLSNGANRNQYIPVPSNQSELSMKILAFKKRAHELVQREKVLMGQQKDVAVNQALNAGHYLSNQNLGSGTNAHANVGAEDGKAVLTLFGNAPQAKHLFSSLQIPAKIDGEDIVQPLREAGLPNGITTTRVVPMRPATLGDDRKRPQTLGELFPTPANIMPLKPPKPAKTSSPASTEGWYQPSTVELAARSASYSKQIITTGQWLDYSNTSSLEASAIRDKTPSINGKANRSEIESTEMDAAKLEALFRSAYSGFAPTKDDSKAIAPEGVMNKLWWQHVGEKRFANLIGSAQNLDDTSLEQNNASLSASKKDTEIEELEQAAKEWSDEAIDPSLASLQPPEEKSIEEKDVEEVLQGISELLETLNSYQRNRHMSPNTQGRTGSVHAGVETSMGTLLKPSDGELATYEIVKSQLTLMIAMLPPYAVAKLNSDQLAELSISTRIEIPMIESKGVMEEDEVAVRARVAAMSAASNTRPTTSSSLHRSTSSTALYGNQYATSRPAASTGHQYYGGTQTPIRPPQTNLQRPPATAPVPVAYPPQRAPTATAYRPTAYSGVSYPHQSRTPGPHMPQYAQPNGQQYHQTPSNPPYARSHSQSYQNVSQPAPQPSMGVRYPSQPPYSTQPQPTQNGVAYPYANGVHVGRQGSPHKPAYSTSTHTTQPLARPQYSTPTPPVPDRRYMQGPLAQPTLTNGASQSPQPQPGLATPQALGPTNYSTFMTAEQQSSMMERQRAQLAQQQGTQHQARNAAQAGAMGSPQPQINTNSAVAAGL